MEPKEALKKVLFGNQKQANVLNDAVVDIVFDTVGNFDGAYTTEDAADVIKGFLDAVIYSGIENFNDEIAVKLITGVKSYELLQGDRSNCEVYMDQPNMDSPKINFRFVSKSGATFTQVDDSERYYQRFLEMSDVDRAQFDRAVEARNELASMPKGENFMDRAEKIKQAILPMISDGVRADIPDNEWAQALCCAEYYYDFHKDDKPALVPVHTPNPNKKAPTKEEIDRIVNMWNSNKSFAEIKEETGRSSEEIKVILKSKGYQVY